MAGRPSRAARHRGADDARRGIGRLHRRDLAADGRRGGAVRHPGALGAAPVRQRDRCGGRGQGRVRGRARAGADRRVGERAEERRAGLTAAVIERQLRAAISLLARHRAAAGLVIAYEPVWAIGTGDAASGEDAQAAAAQIRAILGESDPAGADEVADPLRRQLHPRQRRRVLRRARRRRGPGRRRVAERGGLRADRPAGRRGARVSDGRTAAAARRPLRARRLRPLATTRRATRSSPRGCRPGIA